MAASEKYIPERKKKLLCLCSVAELLMQDVQRYLLNKTNPSADCDVTLANVFYNAVNNRFDVITKNKIHSLTYPCNDCKVYEKDATGNKVVKCKIKIDELDITFIGDILKNFHALTSTTNAQNPCINNHGDYCCVNHEMFCVWKKRVQQQSKIMLFNFSASLQSHMF